MTIYIDQMFLENFIMNFIILYMTLKFSGAKSRWYRLVLGAILGAIYVISSYILGFYGTNTLMPKILLAVFMVLASFKIRNIKEFFKIFIFFFGITLFIGGASFGIAFFTNAYMVQEGGILYVEEFPVIMVAIGTISSFIIFKWILIFLKRKINFKEFIYSIDIEVFDKRVSTRVLLDSGHNVKESFSGYPVIILEKEVFKELVPDDVFCAINKNDFDFDEKWKRRLRIIPISTVSSDEDILIGFRVDRCILYADSSEKYIKKLVVASCDRKLDREGKYFALMGDILNT